METEEAEMVETLHGILAATEEEAMETATMVMALQVVEVKLVQVSVLEDTHLAGVLHHALMVVAHLEAALRQITEVAIHHGIATEEVQAMVMVVAQIIMEEAIIHGIL